jgi:hypothetical protein
MYKGIIFHVVSLIKGYDEKKERRSEKMGKAVFVSPPIPKGDIPPEGVEAEIVGVRVVRDQWTSIGTLSLGLGVEVEIGGATYSQLFSLDRQVLTGSVGRLLVAAGIEDTDTPDLDKKVKNLIGMKVKIQARGGKLYWYPRKK